MASHVIVGLVLLIGGLMPLVVLLSFAAMSWMGVFGWEVGRSVSSEEARARDQSVQNQNRAAILST